MRFFELELDEQQIRSMVKSIINRYEKGLHDHGSQQIAIEVTQEETVQSMENAAELCEELIEYDPRMLH